MIKQMFFIVLALSLSVSCAQAASSAWQTNPHGKVRLILPYTQAPQEGTLRFGIHFVPKPGWLVYWKQSGDAGIPPKFEFKGSRGFKDPRVLWPRPEKFALPGDITEYGYDGEVVYPIEAKAVRAGGTLHIAADITYLTCKESCVPYRYTLTLDAPQGQALADPATEALIQKYISQVPTESDAEVFASLQVHRPGQDTVWMLLLAFFGGVILNIMPCVLPVLSIKLLGLVQQAGFARGLIIRNAIASAAGIVASFIGLGVLAVGARESGRIAGWGIQFQNPWFVGFLLVVIFLFALNLWGVFEIPLPRIFGHFATTYGRGENLGAYFISGIFATLLATPCSAPFLGTAMGFALAQPTPTILTVFGAAGTGMALPYLMLAVFPASLDLLPKPGPWMAHMKRFFGFLLFATAAWLGWVLFQQVQPAKAAPAGGPIQWVEFQEERIPKLIAAGQPVFVDVTADWCVTCKVNERFVLQDPEVVEAFKRRGVVMMRADWTNQNAGIGRYLMKYGRAGIPFYALYYPHREPVVFWELLTKKQILRELKAWDALH